MAKKNAKNRLPQLATPPQFSAPKKAETVVEDTRPAQKPAEISDEDCILAVDLTDEQLEALAAADARRQDAVKQVQPEVVSEMEMAAAPAAPVPSEDDQRKEALEDLKRHGCRRAMVSVEILPQAIAVNDEGEVAEALRGFGCVHANRNRLRKETMELAESAAEEATAYLFESFYTLVQEAKRLFGDAAAARRRGHRLNADGLMNQAKGLIREARQMSFEVFGGPGFAALGRMIESGKMPEAINRRLQEDLEFATEVAGNGKALLNVLLAPPRRNGGQRRQAAGKKSRSSASSKSSAAHKAAKQKKAEADRQYREAMKGQNPSAEKIGKGKQSKRAASDPNFGKKKKGKRGKK